MTFKRIVIIVAGGSGTRMGAGIPKQFLPLLSKPILFHTIQAFLDLPLISEIILVLPASQISVWLELCEKNQFTAKHTIVIGGDTRFQSVSNGLAKVIDSTTLVAIHDGVRPLVSKEVIEKCFQEAEKYGNAIPAVKPLETVRFCEKTGTIPIDREKVLLIQTPQVFKSSIIKQSYQTPWLSSFTDDASVVEHAGYQIHIVEGNRENIKITTPQDLLFAEVLLKKNNPF
ncbi:MAG: 2-C-methyl-D-erythritol 4-phosphate cytidylyltransferase [Bacteroidales bacterium]|nr:2-C-methyl-D-erythritol 4-phosphate cytidylyltransferase [Bacteroidales bacterium]